MEVGVVMMDHLCMYPALCMHHGGVHHGIGRHYHGPALHATKHSRMVDEVI